MKEVSKVDFWNKVKESESDIVSEIVGEYPYTDIFTYRNSHKSFGKIVDSYPENGNKWPIISTYFLA